MPVGWPGDFLCDYDDYVTTDLAVAGPPGTRWTFDEATYLLHCDHAIFSIMRRFVRVLADGTMEWTVPMRWIKWSFGGRLGSAEQWSCNMSMTDASGGASGVDGLILDDIAAVVEPLLRSWWNDSRGFFGNDVYLDELRGSVLEVSSGGAKPTTVVPTRFYSFADFTGGALDPGDGGIALPYEVALCLTFRTALSSRRGRGRIYLPPLSVGQVAAGGLITSSVASAVASNFGYDVLAPAIAGGFEWRVVSQKGATSNEISSVQVGVVPDSQRRRRNALDEARTTAWSR